MKIEDQVTSLEISKRIKELSVPQDSLWWWRVYKKTGEAALTGDAYCTANPGDYDHYPAFTVAELGLLIMQSEHKIMPTPSTNSEGIVSWMIPICLRLEPTYPYCESFDTEANCRGKMLIYLLENNGQLKLL